MHLANEVENKVKNALGFKESLNTIIQGAYPQGFLLQCKFNKETKSNLTEYPTVTSSSEGLLR